MQAESEGKPEVHVHIMSSWLQYGETPECNRLRPSASSRLPRSPLAFDFQILPATFLFSFSPYLIADTYLQLKRDCPSLACFLRVCPRFPKDAYVPMSDSSVKWQNEGLVLLTLGSDVLLVV